MNDISLSSPTREKIAWAEACHERFGSLLLRDKSIQDMLFRMKDAWENSRIEMVKTGITTICRDCEELEGGSCCGEGLEKRYDVWMLLINRLLGINLPCAPSSPENCLFLSHTGCSLMARHTICVNYVCKKITDRIALPKLKTLREKEGEELHLLFLLHERVKALVRQYLSVQ
jgi:hypothetical protein